MPIQINLLAEAQAAEELRRKDPVKRVAFMAAFIVSLAALWGMTLQFKLMAKGSELSSLESQWKTIEADYEKVVAKQREAIEAEQKLAALDRLTTNRFLWGNALHALQQSLSGISDVQAVRLRTEQIYSTVEEVKARTNGSSVVPGQPAAAMEKITVTIDALDSSSQPGGSVNSFKEAIANVPFFKETLAKTNSVLLMSRSAPQASPTGNGQFVLFSLQCNFPEKIR